MKKVIHLTLTLLTLTTAVSHAELPIEAMLILGSFNGNYRVENCIEKNIKNGEEQTVYACKADFAQIIYHHTNGMMQTYLYENASTAVYGRMSFVGQVGCRDMDGIKSNECFTVTPGFYSLDVNYNPIIKCGETESLGHHLTHWELKKSGENVLMTVHEDINLDFCKKDGTFGIPLIMTKDLSVLLKPLK